MRSCVVPLCPLTASSPTGSVLGDAVRATSALLRFGKQDADGYVSWSARMSLSHLNAGRKGRLRPISGVVVEELWSPVCQGPLSFPLLPSTTPPHCQREAKDEAEAQGVRTGVGVPAAHTTGAVSPGSGMAASLEPPTLPYSTRHTPLPHPFSMKRADASHSCPPPPHTPVHQLRCANGADVDGWVACLQAAIDAASDMSSIAMSECMIGDTVRSCFMCVLGWG